MLEFEIEGRPQGKARPRVNTFTKRAYTPQKTLDYEEQVKQAFIWRYGNIEPLECPLQACIYAIFEVPKSYSKKKRAEILENDFVYTKKPDGDNIAKIVLDSLNGLAFKDDAQVADLRVVKLYGEKPKVRVLLDVIKE